MPGKRYLLDTNALVALLQGHQGLLTLTQEVEWLGVSVINVLEFLGFDGLGNSDRDLLAAFVARIHTVDLRHSDQALMQRIADVRKRKAVKLPDAIVLASAVLHNATLLTNDSQLLKLAQDNTAFSVQAF